MPWKVVKRGKSWCVVKAEDGKVIPGGNHDGDKPKAVAHMRAMYANVKD
jgi:hypothetical protein